MRNDNPWIMTTSHKKIYLRDPDPNMFDIRDIAHSLSRINRFNGHLRCASYTVADHSIRVSSACSPEFKFVALLHDASEAYLGDVAKPLKRILPDYKELEHNFCLLLAEHFGLLMPLPEEVIYYDNVLMATEIRDLMEIDPKEMGVVVEPLKTRITNPMSPKEAKDAFLLSYDLLKESKFDLTHTTNLNTSQL